MNNGQSDADGPHRPAATILPPAGRTGGPYAYDGGTGPGVPDIDAMPELYDGILLKRVLAYAVDLVIMGLLLWAGWLALGVAAVVTLGLLWPLMGLYGLVLAPCYHGFLVGGANSATLGMRLFRIHVRAQDGRPPTLIQAFLMSILFYATVPTTTLLILLVVFLNKRRRTLHDLLSGTVVLNRDV